jgi:tetratricopeptide (TPR) repeat protein
MKYLKLWLLPLLLVLPFKTSAGDEDHVQYYIKKYGLADEKNALVRRVHQVFEQVNSVADKKHHRWPQFAVIKNGFSKSGDPLAIALPDGYVVLSQRAVDIIYNKVSREQGDTRVAFVLGHELEHLAKDNFSHLAFFRANQRKNDEIEADKRGFIYAAMAGYSVDKLLAESSRQDNFFTYWEQQTFRGKSGIHPSSDERARLLRERLQNVLEKLPYFHFGVRLSHFGKCDDAIYFFEEFSRDFPAREVFNNWGVCELQRAREELGKAAYSFWLPSVLDATTQLENLSLPSVSKGEDMSPLAKRFFLNAKELFDEALKMDASYLPARVNLAITALYLGEIFEARAAIEKARQLAPDDLEIQGLRAVIMYKEGRQSSYVDMWSKAIQILENLAQQPNVPLSVLYNTARLLEKRGRTGADEIWESLAQKVADLPVPIRHIVCEKTDCPRLRHQAPEATWDLPVKLGVRTKRHKTLDGWPKNSVSRLYDLDEEIYELPNALVLGLRRRVEMVVLKHLENINELSDYCGEPLRERGVVNGVLLSCDNWAALVVGEEVREVWVVKGGH